MQLAFFDMNVPRKAKRQAEKYMRNYRMLEAIIESKKLELETTMTTNYAPSESQRGNQFHSETERITYVRMEIEEYKRVKRQLDLVYKALRPKQRELWEERYIMERTDTSIYTEWYMSERAYYRLKLDMIAKVADALGLNEVDVKNLAE